MRRLGQIYAFTTLIVAMGCGPARFLNEGEFLLNELRVDFNGANPDDLGSFESVLRQQPNAAILGIRIPMRLNLLVNPEKLNASQQARAERGLDSGGWRWWLANRMGEAPVVHDAFLIERSRLNLESLARRRGFLDVTCETVETRLTGQRVNVEYRLNLGKPWTISEWDWDLAGSGLEKHSLFVAFEVPINQRFDVSALDEARALWAQTFRDNGYPTIQASHFSFIADSTAGSQTNQIRVVAQVLPLAWNDDGTSLPHRPARFGQVAWTCAGSGDSAQDCLDQALVSFLIAADSGMRFNETALQETYLRLSKLPSVGRVEIPGAIRTENNLVSAYDVNINIHLRKRFGFTSGVEMVRSDARYGPMVSVAWQDHNVSGKGDTWGAKLTGGLISTRPFSYSSEDLVPNSGTWSVDLNYSTVGLPPLNLERLRPSNQARSRVAVNWVKETRPEYLRQGLGFNYGIEFIENPSRGSKIEWVPVEFRFSDIEAKSDFQNWLSEQENPILSARFADYTSLLSRLEWRTNWNASKAQLGGKLRVNAEWTGVGLDWWNRSRSGNEEIQTFTLGGIPYTHYLRSELEWTVATGSAFSSRAGWYGRLKFGGAITGQNADGIPFDRAFYAGGANGVRGWSVRDLGPGFASQSNSDVGVVQGVGDVQLEGSVEYRRRATDVLEVAWFSDAGNVWLLRQHEAGDGSSFAYRSMAWGSGIGLRLDFEFFLLRLDGALRLYDPSQGLGSRWVGSRPMAGRVHLGIGHAF